MSLTDEIGKLHELHANGALTADEFAQAKARLLRGEMDSPFSAPSAVERSEDKLHQTDAPYRDQLDRLNWQNDLERLDREWEMERKQYLVEDKYGRTSVPTQGSSVVGGVVAIGFGIFWTMMASSITGGARSISSPGFGPPAAVGIFPLFGVLIIVVGVVACISSFNKAGGYQQAHGRYQKRRAELLRQEHGSSRRNAV